MSPSEARATFPLELKVMPKLTREIVQVSRETLRTALDLRDDCSALTEFLRPGSAHAVVFASDINEAERWVFLHGPDALSTNCDAHELRALAISMRANKPMALSEYPGLDTTLDEAANEIERLIALSREAEQA